MGDLPTWYRLLEAARYLGVPHWELAERPVIEMERALVAKDAEAYAEKKLAREAEAKAKARRGGR